MGINLVFYGLFLFVYMVFFWVVTALFKLVLFFFKAVGMSKMMKALGLKQIWTAYIPLFNNYAFSKLASEYVSDNGRKSSKFAIFGTIIGFSAEFLKLVSIVSVSIFALAFVFPEISEIFSEALFTVYLIFVLLISALAGVLYLTHMVLRSIGLWKIYSMTITKNIKMWFIFSLIFYTPMSEILIFINRNKLFAAEEIEQTEDTAEV